MSKSDKKKNILNFLLRLAFSAGLLVFLFSKIDTEKTIEVLKSADMTYIILALIVSMIIYVTILWRWFIFIRALNLSVETRDVVRFFFIGLFGNLFLPSAIGGDIIKIVGLCKNSSEKPRVVASVLLDRLSGFGGIALVAIFSFIFGYSFIEDRSLLFPIACLTLFAVGFSAVLFNEKIYSFGCRIFNAFPKIKDNLMQLHYDVTLMSGKKREGIKAIVISCVNQLIYATSWYLIAKALFQDINIIYFFIYVPITCVASSFPSIGGLGFREAGAAYLFAKAGMDSGIAVSMSLITYLFMVFVGLIGGAVYVFTVSSGRLQHNSSDSSLEPKEA